METEGVEKLFLREMKMLIKWELKDAHPIFSYMQTYI